MNPWSEWVLALFAGSLITKQISWASQIPIVPYLYRDHDDCILGVLKLIGEGFGSTAMGSTSLKWLSSCVCPQATSEIQRSWAMTSNGSMRSWWRLMTVGRSQRLRTPWCRWTWSRCANLAGKVGLSISVSNSGAPGPRWCTTQPHITAIHWWCSHSAASNRAVGCVSLL